MSMFHQTFRLLRGLSSPATWRWTILLVVCLLVSVNPASAAEPQVRIEKASNQLKISFGPQVVARYVYQDEEIPRPYFCDVCTVDGIQVTRNHPPREGVDLTDHPNYHPGIWMAFGELGGGDFWRNKAVVNNVALEVSSENASRAGFTVRNRYETDGSPVCEEECHIEFVPCPAGYYLLWTSTFTPTAGSVAFGDQEEMGLGVRLATNLIVKEGGHVLNSHGDRDEAGAWGKQAAWCDYGGSLNRKHLGVLLMPHPGNFRESWFHVRDYGLLLANPFGRNAFTRGEKSRVEVSREAPLTLKFGICVYSEGEAVDYSQLYDQYLSLTDSK